MLKLDASALNLVLASCILEAGPADPQLVVDEPAHEQIERAQESAVPVRRFTVVESVSSMADERQQHGVLRMDQNQITKPINKTNRSAL